MNGRNGTGAADPDGCLFKHEAKLSRASEPELELNGDQTDMPDLPAVAGVVLIEDLGEQVPLKRVAASDFQAAHWRVPTRATERTHDLIKTKMIHPGGDIQTGPNLIAAFER